MSVTQLCQHIAQYLLQLIGIHIGVQLLAISGTHFVPIQSYCLTFIFEKAIMLVDDFPKRLQIALGSIGKLHLVHTRAQGKQGKYNDEKSFHTGKIRG
jgi:hypothetical protein